MSNILAKIFSNKVYIKTHGCPRRSLDAQRLKRYFERNGFIVVSHPAIADFIIINTCAFLEATELMSVDEIMSMKKYRGELIVTGCLPVINPQRLATVHNGLSIPAHNLDSIDSKFSNFKYKFRDISDGNTFFQNSNLSGSLSLYCRQVAYNYGTQILRNVLGIKESQKPTGDTVPANESTDIFYIRVSRGCNRHCTYCAIWKAIGQVHSKSHSLCISEFKKGLAAGYRNFNFMSDNVGAYGIDINTNLPSLLREIVKIKGDYTISISDIHPEWLIKYEKDFIELLKSDKITFIMVPIQSCNNRILTLMGRINKFEEYKKTITALQNVSKSLEFQTQIIVGFPSESEKDFKETVQGVLDIGFSMVCVYEYSDRPNTVASSLKPKNPPDVIHRRATYAKSVFKKNNISFQEV